MHGLKETEIWLQFRHVFYWCATFLFTYCHIFVCAGIIAGALGTLTGAGIAHCVKIGKNMGIVNWVTVMIAVVPLLGFFLTCPNVDVIGIGTQYTNK